MVAASGLAPGRLGRELAAVRPGCQQPRGERGLRLRRWARPRLRSRPEMWRVAGGAALSGARLAGRVYRLRGR
eukprot:9665265-Alexandrium_andersonii.AAC.1